MGAGISGSRLHSLLCGRERAKEIGRFVLPLRADVIGGGNVAPDAPIRGREPFQCANDLADAQAIRR